MMKNLCFVFLSGLLIVVFAFTEKKNSFEVTSFNALTNNEFGDKDTFVLIEADLSDAPLYGIRIPSANQCKEGKIAFNFTIKNTGRKKLYYKLLYQNLSYKFPETHPYNNENFYGSWESDTIGFKPLPGFDKVLTVKDSLVIVGNPRNEKKYYGENPAYKFPDDQLIVNTIAFIKDDKNWFKQIVEKSKTENRSVDEQLKLDALWSINEKKKLEGNINNRLWRNPRMGKYEFMLVVVSEDALKKLPAAAKRTDQTDIKGNYTNPLAYFTTGSGSLLEDVIAIKAKRKLITKAKFNLGAGIFVDNNQVGAQPTNKEFYSSVCGDKYSIYRKAHFQQYFHYINKDFPLKNIPEIMDVMDTAFTRKKYDEIKANYEKSGKTIDTYVNSSDCPCKTVISDTLNNIITIVNPGNKPGEYKKEQVGVFGRIGFTYGKWRAKIKFPELINEDNVWVGLTNAFWLLAEETEKPWNHRRECKHEIGYIPKAMPDSEASLRKSKKQDSYSEIDFEILKESQYWPTTSYPQNIKAPSENAAELNDITVTCTNWDLACHEPKKFDIGAKKNIIEGKEFVHHRWNHWYKALTTKVPFKNDEMFKSDFYYFEIDWQPTKIIWRIGPTKDKMKTVCIMDQTVSAIPNNQMIPVVTQEWHNQEWWPTAPFKQNFVPFPKTDIIGKILEVEVE